MYHKLKGGRTWIKQRLSGVTILGIQWKDYAQWAVNNYTTVLVVVSEIIDNMSYSITLSGKNWEKMFDWVNLIGLVQILLSLICSRGGSYVTKEI